MDAPVPRCDRGARALLDALDRLRESPVCLELFEGPLSAAVDEIDVDEAEARLAEGPAAMARQCSNPCLADYAAAFFHVAYCQEDREGRGLPVETVQAFELQCVKNERGDFCLQAMTGVNEGDLAEAEAGSGGGGGDPCRQLRRTGCCFPTFLHFHAAIRAKLSSGEAGTVRAMSAEDVALDTEFQVAEEAYRTCAIDFSLCPIDFKLNVTGFARDRGRGDRAPPGLDMTGWESSVEGAAAGPQDSSSSSVAAASGGLALAALVLLAQ